MKLFLAGALFLAAPLSAQSAHVAKGQHVALLVPLSALRFKDSKYHGSVSFRGDSLTVDDSSSRHTRSPLIPVPFSVKDVSTDKSTGRVIVHLGGGGEVSDVLIDVNVLDTARAFHRLFDAGENAQLASDRDLDSAAAWLSGDHSPSGVKHGHALIAVGIARSPWDTLVESWRGTRYLWVMAPEPKYTYNNNQTNEAERNAGTINEVAFPLIKKLGAAVTDSIPGAGFAVVIVVKHKDMAGRYSWLNSTAEDRLTIYVPADLAAKFSRADITAQDVVDGSIVMFKGNRIKVDLTK
ncbi:MAG TPA: hypothetical protein VGM20_08605 [Gemmatimonadales bacterium]